MIPTYPYVFPGSNEYFPMISQSSLITSAFIEAKAITQAPDAMVYLTEISSVSTALQGLINVELPTGKVCPVSLWSLTIAESGERKSTVENLLTKSIKLFQKEKTKINQNKLEEYKIKLGLYEAKATQIKRKGLIK